MVQLLRLITAQSRAIVMAVATRVINLVVRNSDESSCNHTSVLIVAIVRVALSIHCLGAEAQEAASAAVIAVVAVAADVARNNATSMRGHYIL